MNVKRRRILGYAFKATKENELQVLGDFYGVDVLGLSTNQASMEADLKKSREEGNFPKSAKARKFRIVLEELE